MVPLEILGETSSLPLPAPGGSEVKASAWNAGDLGSIPESGRSPGEGNGNPLQYSCLIETVRVAKSTLRQKQVLLKELLLPIVRNGEGNGTPLQYSCLENPVDRGAWWATVHGVARSRTRLSNFTFTFHLHALEK